jgi:signal transduction histidine kinase
MSNNQSKRARQLSRLIELNHLAARLDSSTLLQTIVDMAAELTQSDYCSILIHDPQADELRFIAGPWLHMPVLAKISVPVEGSIAGATLRYNEPQLLTAAEQDSRLYRRVEELLGIRTRTLLSVPVRFREQVLGVLQAVNRTEGEYDHEDTAFLLSLAAQAGAALYLQQLETQIVEMQAKVGALEEHKTSFISITSHELRTPLGIILGNATFLRQMLNNPEFRPHLDAIVISALRLKEVIESLGRADNLQSGTARLRAEEVDLNALIADVATGNQAEANRRKIQLTIHLEQDNLIVEAEADKIVVVLQNLLRNALAFTDEGGFVQVSSQRIPGYAQVTVTDTGIGIPTGEQGRIFERFYQVESHLTRHHGGMGLGLSVARAMIELHGGQIWVESQVGRGSTFSFVLPEKQVLSKLPEPKEVPASQPDSAGLNRNH